MEQTTQQIIQKPPLPVKTKIVAWWLIIQGALGLVVTSISINGTTSDRLRFEFPLSNFFLLIPGIFLLKGKRLAFWFSIIILILISIPLAFPLSGLAELLFNAPIVGYLLSILYNSYVSVVVYLLRIFSGTYNSLDIIIPFVSLIPLILLLLDRKNFFKIAN